MTNEKTEIEIQTFDIPSWNMPVVEAKVGKLNKRAEKIGCDLLQVIIHDEKLVTDPAQKVDMHGGYIGDDLPKIKVFTIEIKGAGPIIDGWKFVGTLDHYSLPGQVIVNTVPGEMVPTQFHHSDAICDHCDKIRTRKETFVLEDEDGEYKQVGRQCIKDFLGHNPQRIATFLQSLYKFMAELEDEGNGDWGRGGRSEYYYELDSVLKITAGVIRTFGWTPKSAAGEDREPSSSYVFRIMNPPTGAREQKHWKELVAQVGVNDTTDVEDATKSLEWLNEQDGDNEYMHNLKAIAEAGQLTGKLLGYACSIVSAYQRAMDKLEYTKRENAKKLNEWVEGDVKERLEMTLTLNKTRLLDGMFGTVVIHNMMDDNGRTVTWFCNGDSDMEKGKTYRVAATLKKFDKFNDWKQTHVNRVRVLEEIENA